jgi:hypothetical protein
MKSVQFRYIGAVTLLVIVAALLIPLPDAVPSTYAAILAFLLGAGAVIILSWRNALPTDTIGQLLQRTEAPDASTFEKRRR